jgi:hypothetical protein
LTDIVQTPLTARPDNANGKNVPAVPSVDPRIVARTHFEELSRYLAVYLAKGELSELSIPKDLSSVLIIPSFTQFKIERKTEAHEVDEAKFQELSIDVYDELVRRKKPSVENEGMLEKSCST